MNEVPSAPYIKPKKFMYYLCKAVTQGVPANADSIRDPSVIGTYEWMSYWENELVKIKNGFKIDDIWIPGRFYWYMCYKQMTTIKGVVTPDMVDLHLELAYYIEYCKANGKNLLCAKGRRKGISEAASTMIIDYGWRFEQGYKGGVAAGNKTYVEDFIAKWRFADSRVPPEFSLKKLVDNDDEIIAGYQIRDQYGAYNKSGSMNTIYARTMHNNPNMFKGLYLNDIISEEIGEHENWIEFFGASKDTLMSGNVQVGMLTAFGTGGNINKGSKDFKKVWHEADMYNFVKFLIPATRFYFYGGATEENRRLPAESELLKQYSNYQLIGCEDIVLSEKDVMQRRERFLKQGNLKEYNEDLQNNPLNATEIFRKTVVNDFDINILNAQMSIIDNLTHPKYTKYKLDWVKDEAKGTIKMPLEVKATALKPTDDPDECVWIIDTELPRKGYINLYVGGLDAYDQDRAKASKSLGAMCILIRDNNIDGAMKKAPVAVISCRPKRKEKFYDLCIKLAVFYPLNGNVLGDVSTALVMNHFRDNGLWHLLADRPRKFESESSEQTHEKWVRLTSFAKPRMSSLMQSAIIDNGKDIWFPELINQLQNYDEVEIGSDNDLADAYGMALMQDVSCDIKPRNLEAEVITDRFDLPQFVSDGNGGMVLKNGGGSSRNIQQDENLFKNMFGLDRT